MKNKKNSNFRNSESSCRTESIASCGVINRWSTNFHVWCVNVPDTNLLLTRDTLYPDPSSSNSAPLRVVPSQLNWAAMVPCDPGPSDNWNLALMLPIPDTSLNLQRALLVSSSHTPLGSLTMSVTTPSTGTERVTFCRAVVLINFILLCEKCLWF